MRAHQLLLPVAAVAAAVAAAIGFPAGAETRTFKESNFDSVSASAGVQVILKQGPFAISVEEPDGKFDRLKLVVEGSTLTIGRKSDISFFPGAGPRYTVTVTAPTYKALNASSGSRLNASDLRADGLRIGASSGAHVELSGTCASLTVEASSGAHFDGEHLKCANANVHASSGGHAEAFATAVASGAASSGAHVAIYGKPAQFSKDASSGGSVSSL